MTAEAVTGNQLQITTGLAKRQAAGAGDPVMGFDIVTYRAFVVIVVHARAGKLRAKSSNLSHD